MPYRTDWRRDIGIVRKYILYVAFGHVDMEGFATDVWVIFHPSVRRRAQQRQIMESTEVEDTINDVSLDLRHDGGYLD